MKTPANEIHIQVLDPHPEIPVPGGHFLRFYSESDDGPVFFGRGPQREGPWEEVGPLSARLFHVILYDLGLLDIDDHYEPASDERIDMFAYQERRRAGNV